MNRENSTGLSRSAWVSLGVFAFLLVLVVVTREDRMAAGIRKLELPKIEKTEVKRVEVSGKDSAVLEKDGASWVVYDPKTPDNKHAAEQSSVDAALDAVGELEAGAFVTARKEKHAELEIDDDKGLRVKIDGAGTSLDLVFGRFAKGGGNYVRRAGSDEVFVGKGRLASLVKKDVNGWRKRKLLDVEADALAKVVVEPAGGGAYTIEADKGEGEGKKTWRFAEGTELPAGFRTDAMALSRVASSLASLRAADFAEDVKDEDAGLVEGSESGGKVTATLDGGKSVTVRFGKEDDKKRVYARVDGDPQLYLLSGYSVKALLKDKLELRDLTLAPFEASAAERAVFQSPNGVVEVKKQDGVWTLVQPATPPPGFEFDASGVEGKLAALARARGASLVEPAPAPAATGLSSPAIAIEVTLQGGETKRIAFGNEAPKEGDKGGQEFFAHGDGGLVYRAATFVKSRYEKPLELFKKVEAPPPAPGGFPGGGGGLDQLPPEVRKQLEQALKQRGGG